MSLPTRKIGTTPVSAIGYGGMGLSICYGVVPSDEERLAFLDSLYERGCTYWDTADVYGDNEDIIGKWFARTGKRKEIFLSTKFGIGDRARVPNGTPEYAVQQIANSLKRLQTDYIDLWYLHRPDPQVPIEKTIGAMAQFVKEGKVKYLGVSEVSAKSLRRAHAVHPISAVQLEYSPSEIGIESEEIGVLKVARELGIAVVAYSPLGRGLLAGQVRKHEDLAANDYRRAIPRFNPENFPNYLQLADALAEIGKAHDATASQVALAWLLAQGDDIIPIPGTKKIKFFAPAAMV
ncbi:NADP-dependent oxidoreductase domain-containing protein [Amylostereum chailletii]|nr:NADP-dependent oxidoreductase domain-containing protein [Amylostereum chailletii]